MNNKIFVQIINKKLFKLFSQGQKKKTLFGQIDLSSIYINKTQCVFMRLLVLHVRVNFFINFQETPSKHAFISTMNPVGVCFITLSRKG